MTRKSNPLKKTLPTVSPRITSADIARELGISAMTVSWALNNRPNVKEETRRQVARMARRMEYIPHHMARSLVLRRTLTIGVAAPAITHSFFPEAIRGIEDAIYAAGYHLFLTHSAEKAERERDALQTLESKRVDGILISTIETAARLRSTSMSSNAERPWSFSIAVFMASARVVFVLTTKKARRPSPNI